jgi:hypothetical protein
MYGALNLHHGPQIKAGDGLRERLPRTLSSGRRSATGVPGACR